MATATAKELKIRLDELRRLKKISCFNIAYANDPQPAKFVDMRIAELKELIRLKSDPDWKKLQAELREWQEDA